jgi:Protein of unknown function (DUF4241)
MGGGWIQMMPQWPDFESRFVRSSLPGEIRPGDPGVAVVVEVRNAGRLHLPTGRLVVCEPLWVSDLDSSAAAFTVTVPPGRYPATVALARFDEPVGSRLPPQRRGAAAKPTVRDEPVARWEAAVRPGHHPLGLRAGHLDRFAVNRGTGAFLDGSVLATLAPLTELGPEGQDPQSTSRS